MRVAVVLLFCAALSAGAVAQPAVPIPPARANTPATTPLPVSPQILSPADVALYRQIMAAAHAGELTKARRLQTQVSDPVLQGYGEAIAYLALPQANVRVTTAVTWLEQYRDTAIADRIYRLAVANSTRTVRRGKKRIRVTNSFAMGTILLQVELREPGWVSNGVLFPGCGITSTRGTALECRRSGERIYSLGQHQ